jgi:hypothetical protein
VAGREAVCANNSVYAYLRYLSRLQYGHLLAADAGTEDFEFGGLVTLEDDRGVKDTLDVVQKNADEFMVRHRLARQVSTLTAAQASLLFPAADAVLDTLQEPSRYERVAPRAPGLF